MFKILTPTWYTSKKTLIHAYDEVLKEYRKLEDYADNVYEHYEKYRSAVKTAELERDLADKKAAAEILWHDKEVALLKKQIADLTSQNEQLLKNLSSALANKSEINVLPINPVKA